MRQMEMKEKVKEGEKSSKGPVPDARAVAEDESHMPCLPLIIGQGGRAGQEGKKKTLVLPHLCHSPSQTLNNCSPSLHFNTENVIDCSWLG